MLIPALGLGFVISMLVSMVCRFGALKQKDHHHHHMGQPYELFSKLVFAWPCIYIWCLTFLCPGLMILYTKNGDSGNGWVTNICLASRHAGNITSFGRFLKPLLSSLALVSVAGLNLLHQSHVGIGRKI